MDTSLDNANNPFANSNGSDNKTSSSSSSSSQPPQQPQTTESLKTDGFLLNLTTENNYKQNGSNVDDLLSSSPIREFYTKLAKSNGKRLASEFDDDDDNDEDDIDEENNDNVIDNDNERDQDDNDIVVDDLGPETDVDTADVLSPSMITAKALADGIMNNNPEGSFNPFIEKEEVEKAALEIHRDLQKQISEDDVDEIVERKSSATPILEGEKTDPSADVPVHDVGGSLEENVADSGDDSEDEWNYIKGDEANKENLNPTQPELLKVASSIEEDLDNMSQLNPNAAEFVPVSPTRSIPSPACQALINDPVISQSPKRASDMDINVPNPLEFENEVKSRPSDVGVCDSNGHEEINDQTSPTQELENLLNGKNIDEIPEFQPTSTGLTSTKISNDEFHFGPNATPFTPVKLLDQSETALSTKAVYGDESTATIASFDESAFTQDNVDFTSTLNKEHDPMSMSFYQEKTTESDTIDLNRVQTLPDDLDEFLTKTEELQQLDNTVITKTEQSNDIINLVDNERVQTTDLDKFVDDEKDIASPVDNDLSDDVCVLPKSTDLISNEIIEKENEEEKEKGVEKEEFDEKETTVEKELEDEKENEPEEVEAVCDKIAKSPELIAVSPSPEPIQNDLLQNHDNNLQINHLIPEEVQEPQQQQQILDDLVEQKSETPEPELEITQEENRIAASPLPTHEPLASPEVPLETSTVHTEIAPSPEPTLEESHHYTQDEINVIDNSDILIDIEKNEESLIGSPVEDVTLSVKDSTSPVIMSPIPDQIVAPVAEQVTTPVDESTPIIGQQSEVLVPEICAFSPHESVATADVPEICALSPPESVATADVHSFLDRSDISDVHSPLEGSPVAVVPLTNDENNEPIISNQANIFDLDHPLSRCVFPLPTETEISVKTEQLINDNKVEDNKSVEDASSVVEEKTKQTENSDPEIAATTVVAIGAAAVVAAAATTAAAEKKTADKGKTATKKITMAANKTAPSKTTGVASKSKLAAPATTKPSTTSRPISKIGSSVASPKSTSTTKTTTLASRSTTKPKTNSPTTTHKYSIDKKPLANGDVKSARSTTAIKKTDSTTTTAAKPPSSLRPVSSTVNKTSPSKIRHAANTTTALAKVSSSTTSKISSTTTSKISSTTLVTTTTTTAAKPRPATLAPRTTSTTKTTPTSRTSSASATSKTTVPKTACSTKTLSSPRAPPRLLTTTMTAKPRAPLNKTITKTSADAEKQHKESANKLTASRSTTTSTTKTTGKTFTSTLKKTEAKNAGTKTTVTKTTTTITGKKPNELTRNLKTTTTKTTKIEKPIQNGISSVITEQIIVNNDNEPQLVKDNSPIDNKLIVEANATD